MDRVIIGADDIYKVVLAQICSGMIASGRKDDNAIIDEAKCWAKVIMEEKYYENKPEERRSLGLFDAAGNKIFEGDIFVYGIDKRSLPVDLINNYKEKYSMTIELHPVFWDEDDFKWASDVYGDSDTFAKYDMSKVIVVSNNIDHPELYNH